MSAFSNSLHFFDTSTENRTTVMKIFVLSCTVMAVVSMHSVHGMQGFLEKMPNGDKFTQDLGHPGKDSSKFTPYAKEWAANRFKWDAAFCKTPFPGSTMTKGEAFGDPCCTWTQKGDPVEAIEPFTLTPTKQTQCKTAAGAVAAGVAVAAGGATTTGTAGVAATSPVFAATPAVVPVPAPVSAATTTTAASTPVAAATTIAATTTTATVPVTATATAPTTVTATATAPTTATATATGTAPTAATATTTTATTGAATPKRKCRARRSRRGRRRA